MYFDSAQTEAGVTFLAPAILDYVVNGRIASRMGNQDPYMAPHSVYPCSGEERWAAIAVATDAEWEALCRVMGNPEWARDPRFATLLGRKHDEEELNRLIAGWTRNYTPEQLMELLQGAGVACGVVQTAEDLFKDRQLNHRQHWHFLKHEVMGPHGYEAPAYRLSKTPARLWRAAPCLGQDNEFMYEEQLGYSDEEVTQFLLDGVITTDHDVPEILKPKRT